MTSWLDPAAPLPPEPVRRRAPVDDLDDSFKLTLSFDPPAGDLVYVISSPGVPSEVQRAFKRLAEEIEEGHRFLFTAWSPRPEPSPWKPSQDILDRIRMQAEEFAEHHQVDEDTVVEVVTARVSDACVNDVLREIEAGDWLESTYFPHLVDLHQLGHPGVFRRHWLG